MIDIKYWNDLTDEPLTLENVKKRYTPASKYRIQFNFREPRRSSNGFWQKTSGFITYYIQKGTVIFKNEETLEEVTLGPGCIVKLPGGDYECKVISEIRLEFIQVLELPDGWG
ncbi:hypothetical protein [Acinetobacter sp.]|jgi:hypothetical protein|uniref:hypothetical protein n=1 Tax=Acinetobacter sp. TaxID=472 RepID=UPI0039827E07